MRRRDASRPRAGGGLLTLTIESWHFAKCNTTNIVDICFEMLLSGGSLSEQGATSLLKAFSQGRQIAALCTRKVDLLENSLFSTRSGVTRPMPPECCS